MQLPVWDVTPLCWLLWGVKSVWLNAIRSPFGYYKTALKRALSADVVKIGTMMQANMQLLDIAHIQELNL